MKKLTPKELCKALINLRKITELNKLLGISKTNITNDIMWDGDHFTEIVSALLEAGWNSTKSLSKCTKATNEITLEAPESQGNTVINILTANFLGVFTEIKIKRYIT